MSITLTTGAKALRRGLQSYGEFRDRQAEKAYDSLLGVAKDGDQAIRKITDDGDLADTAKKVRKKSARLLKDAREEAGTLTQEAHQRIEEALASLDPKTRDYRRDAADAQERAIAQSRLIGRRTRRRAAEAGRLSAEKAQKKYEKRARRDRRVIKALDERDGTKKKRRSILGVAGIIAVVLAAAAAVAYWWANRGNKPVATTPPRVEEFSGNHGKAAELVYTTPGDGGDAPQEKGRGVTDIDPRGVPDPGTRDVPSDDLTPEERTALKGDGGGAHRLREN